LDVEEVLIGIGAQYNSTGEYYYIPCSDLETANSIEITIGSPGYTFTLDPSDYTLEFGDICVVAISSLDDGMWILGDVFMRKFYVVFDMSSSQVGIATAV